jgi:hypothetical protein
MDSPQARSTAGSGRLFDGDAITRSDIATIERARRG